MKVLRGAGYLRCPSANEPHSPAQFSTARFSTGQEDCSPSSLAGGGGGCQAATATETGKENLVPPWNPDGRLHYFRRLGRVSASLGVWFGDGMGTHGTHFLPLWCNWIPTCVQTRSLVREQGRHSSAHRAPRDTYLTRCLPLWHLVG